VRLDRGVAVLLKEKLNFIFKYLWDDSEENWLAKVYAAELSLAFRVRDYLKGSLFS
jgi:hypothetical protein